MYNDEQPRDEQGRWTSGGFGYTRDELAEELDRIRGVGDARSDKTSKHIELPKREYAELCSAVRTKFTNRIPSKGQILYGNNYYEFRYSHISARIVCTKKLRITCNERKIDKLIQELEDE